MSKNPSIVNIDNLGHFFTVEEIPKPIQAITFTLQFTQSCFFPSSNQTQFPQQKIGFLLSPK